MLDLRCGCAKALARSLGYQFMKGTLKPQPHGDCSRVSAGENVESHEARTDLICQESKSSGEKLARTGFLRVTGRFRVCTMCDTLYGPKKQLTAYKYCAS